MVPVSARPAPRRPPAPRTRGDGPSPCTTPEAGAGCSPHPRGWSVGVELVEFVDGLLPAPAGMVPSRTRSWLTASSAPRTRGDGPLAEDGVPVGGLCSPHPRGWSQPDGAHATTCRLLPAPAGMVPRRPGGPAGRPPAPRTRGDGPPMRVRRLALSVCSPHPRGWSPGWPGGRARCRLLPAPAGMVPPPAAPGTGSRPAPRTRGDGPRPHPHRARHLACSPHPRGWSRAARADPRRPVLLPAPAGMVPARRLCLTHPSAAPRTRGDGPGGRYMGPHSKACSPHPRGWSPRDGPGAVPHPLLPAPAGMVPGSPPFPAR